MEPKRRLYRVIAGINKQVCVWEDGYTPNFSIALYDLDSGKSIPVSYCSRNPIDVIRKAQSLVR